MEKSYDSPIKKITPYEAEKGEPYMSSQQLHHFKEILLEWRNSLVKGSSQAIELLKEEVKHHPDPLDRASQEEEFNINLRTREREQKLIQKINQSLDMIHKNEYGFCASCGVEIGLQRMEARLTANQCIDCKSLTEQKERLYKKAK